MTSDAMHADDKNAPGPPGRDPDVSRVDELEALTAQLDWGYTDSEVRRFIFEAQTHAYEVRARYVAWASAVLAAASALTVVGDLKWVAAGLSIAAAMASGYIAEVKPLALAEASRKAAVDYEAASMRLGEALTKISAAQETAYQPVDGHTPDGETYDAGYYYTRYDLTKEERASLAQSHTEARNAKLQIKKDAPSISDKQLRKKWDKYDAERSLAESRSHAPDQTSAARDPRTR